MNETVDLVGEYRQFRIGLVRNKSIERKESTFVPSNDPALVALLKKKKFKQSFIDVIMQVNNCTFKWVDPKDTNICGLALIQGIESIVNCTCEEDVDEEEEGVAPLDKFHLVDMVRPDRAVGIFSGKHAGDSLYMYSMNGVPQYLGLNMEGYVKMLIATRGFDHWQGALWQHHHKDRSFDSLGRMKEHLPRLFPEVKVEELLALYDSLRISEKMPPGTE